MRDGGVGVVVGVGVGVGVVDGFSTRLWHDDGHCRAVLIHVVAMKWDGETCGPLSKKPPRCHRDVTKAMILALALNDITLLRRAYEGVPVASIPLVVASVGAPLLPALVRFLCLELRPSTGTPHFEFHLQWVLSALLFRFLAPSGWRSAWLCSFLTVYVHFFRAFQNAPTVHHGTF